MWIHCFSSPLSAPCLLRDSKPPRLTDSTAEEVAVLEVTRRALPEEMWFLMAYNTVLNGLACWGTERGLILPGNFRFTILEHLSKYT
ncbi:hypothetical protein MUK42_14229 [Musa troglodytarum]|uniref:Uncharacterized protein n=1 Tax=Musa troglodytarum TaxID=320322 RepID=A0A9E7I6H8_9LILI|nr:hypothetical protein MUK42_14229 [Musa troglodytarum]